MPSPIVASSNIIAYTTNSQIQYSLSIFALGLYLVDAMADSSENLKGPESPSEVSDNAEQGKQDAPAPESRPLPGPAAPTSYPPPMIFAVNMFALYISIFCVALDNTIISTAIPRITDQFHALDDVGWYGSGRLKPFALYHPSQKPKF